MAKLKQLVQQLSPSDYEALYYSLLENNAEKSAYLLQSLRNGQIADNNIMKELDVNANAYYTLRSRLYQKIEEYLLARMESPRSDLLKKVATIVETLFTKRKAITIAALKRLERELIDHDLSNELTTVYKTLKKLHIGTNDYFVYSRQYNEHVAYTLAVDKAEDLLVNYFRKFGTYFLSGAQEDLQDLIYVRQEMNNVCNLYQSHRLYVYGNCLELFHRIVIEKDEDPEDHYQPVEEIIEKIGQIFSTYHNDPVYFHLGIVLDYLQMLYYQNYKVFKKFEKHYEEVNERIETFLENYTLHTFPCLFLLSKLERYHRLNLHTSLASENANILSFYEPDTTDEPSYIIYMVYRAVSCFYAQKYHEAIKFLTTLLENAPMKRYALVQIEVKAALCIQYSCAGDIENLSHLMGSVQRQIRILGKEECLDVFMMLKVIKGVHSGVGSDDKLTRMRILFERYRDAKEKYKRMFSPLKYLVMDERFIMHLLGQIQ